MAHHATPCHAMPHHATPCNAMPHHATSNHAPFSTLRHNQVVVRYVDEMALLTPPQGVVIVARHKALGAEASTGLTRVGGICELSGAEALFVGELYSLEVGEGAGVSLKTTEVTVQPGAAPAVIDVQLGPASAEVTVVVEEARRRYKTPFTTTCSTLLDPSRPDPLHPARYHLTPHRDLSLACHPPQAHHEKSAIWSGKLGLPLSIAFEIFATPRPSSPKVRAATGKDGRCVLGCGHQLFVGNTYTIEVTKAPAIEPISLTFEVVPGEQTLRLRAKRACGLVRGVFTMELADAIDHWASKLPLPWPMSFRVTHKALGVVVHEAEAPRNASHTYQTALPSDGLLFADETYVLEVGYQASEQVVTARAELAHTLSGRALSFNGAADASLPHIERCWSVDFLFDDAKFTENHEVLEAVALLVRSHHCIHLEVRCDAARTPAAPERLADHYKMNAFSDSHLLMEHLARNRAAACVTALVERGVDRSRLRLRHSARGDVARTSFTPVLPNNSVFVGDPRTGLVPASCEFTVQRGAQDAVLRLAKATGDVRVYFTSTHADNPNHWSHTLQVPAGVRVRILHTERKVEVASGVVSGGSCYFVGRDRLFVNEHYTLHLEGSNYFTQNPSTLVLQQGVQDAPIRVSWQARQVLCFLTSADRGSLRRKQAAEALARVKAFMADRAVVFNGAGEDGLPSVSQAWSVRHLDEDRATANLETLGGVARIMKDYPGLKCKVGADRS